MNGDGSVELSNCVEGEKIGFYLNVSFVSSLIFFWVGFLIFKGYKKILDLEDVFFVLGEDNVNEVYRVFRSFLECFNDSIGRKVIIM